MFRNLHSIPGIGVFQIRIKVPKERPLDYSLGLIPLISVLAYYDTQAEQLSNKFSFPRDPVYICPCIRMDAAGPS